MSDRRYDEKEVAEIFKRATEAQAEAARLLPPTEGMTLAELLEIGRQAGIATDSVADAARSLDRHEPRFRRQLLGFTIGVGRTVALDHRVTDEEWERLVVRLRETFDARGNAKTEGNLRQWTNGNLQVLVEPTEHGDRLRMRTVHANARMSLTMGAGVLGAVSLVALVAVVARVPDAMERIRALSSLAGMGIALLGIGMVRLRGWAATRMQQMDDIASHFR
ncbi:MAG: hypothetical protein HYR75_09995 [Gemmatimonadetes bacterium]|nr:hypothetical protein [Gemmatimonadota bacterium]MBI3504250.1 hypothetical protein [Pseudomonadota bacterium]